ncbi:MAG: hypothetical protein NTV54_00085 [Ignavibacteriales bacterium]|nr:hypothetical protein [Ignavibacteriales bacterium]
MGRTVPTFTNIIDHEIASWSKFRRGLRKQDQKFFDDLFRCARIHLAENFYTMRAVPLDSIMMSILLEQRKMIQELNDRIAALEEGRALSAPPRTAVPVTVPPHLSLLECR